jgi:hypothetical protein
MISRIRLATDCFAPCKTKILLRKPRGVALFAVLPENQKSVGLPLGDSPEVAVARTSTVSKFKYSVLSEWGPCQGFKECDSGLLICVLSSNGRED